MTGVQPSAGPGNKVKSSELLEIKGFCIPKLKTTQRKLKVDSCYLEEACLVEQVALGVLIPA